MTHVATLVCNPNRPVLDKALVARVAQNLADAQTPIWLADGVAADVSFEISGGAALKETYAWIRENCAGSPVDVIIQPASGRRKKLLVADMDSTMIGQECLDELADFVGMKANVAAITARAMRGEIAFEPALRERVALLAGLHADVIAKILAERITFTPGGATLVKTMRAHGAFTALVSSGFTQFAAPIAEKLGFNTSFANRLMIADGKLTGDLAEAILDENAKLATLRRLRNARGLAPSETLAVGDGANDLAMLLEAGLGVGFHPKPLIAAQIDVRIDHADLTALLYAQGFSRAEFLA